MTTVLMSPEQQRELRLTLALMAGWIIRAIEEYGVGGPHMPDTPEFISASQPLLERIGKLYEVLGCVPGDRKYSITEVTRMLIQGRGNLASEAPSDTASQPS